MSQGKSARRRARGWPEEGLRVHMTTPTKMGLPSASVTSRFGAADHDAIEQARDGRAAPRGVEEADRPRSLPAQTRTGRRCPDAAWLGETAHRRVWPRNASGQPIVLCHMGAVARAGAAGGGALRRETSMSQRGPEANNRSSGGAGMPSGSWGQHCAFDQLIPGHRGSCSWLLLGPRDGAATAVQRVSKVTTPHITHR